MWVDCAVRNLGAAGVPIETCEKHRRKGLSSPNYTRPVNGARDDGTSSQRARKKPDHYLDRSRVNTIYQPVRAWPGAPVTRTRPRSVLADGRETCAAIEVTEDVYV